MCERILSSMSEQSSLLRRMAQRRRQREGGEGGGEEGEGGQDEEKVVRQLQLDVQFMASCLSPLGIAHPSALPEYQALCTVVQLKG